MFRRFVSICVVAMLAASTTQSQQPMQPKPGAEHAVLKQFEGTWDATMEMGGQKSKGTMVFKMDLGGLWLVYDFKGEFGGAPFQGRGMDTYDLAKKKYVSVWADSMMTSPMVSEGSFDKAGKVMTMVGEAPDPSGKVAKMKSVTEIKDKDTILFTMNGPGPDGKEGVMFTITYKRKK